MAAYRRVYDSHHLQADCKEQVFVDQLRNPTLDNRVGYGLPLPFYTRGLRYSLRGIATYVFV